MRGGGSPNCPSSPTPWRTPAATTSTCWPTAAAGASTSAAAGRSITSWARREALMADLAGFLQAIRDDPDDDDVRLVFADWLEEQGAPRGEFIRTQVELARSKEEHPSWPRWKLREHVLLEQHQEEWAHPVWELMLTGMTFRRGFIEAGQWTAERFVHDADRLFDQTPLRELELSLGSGPAHVLAGSAHLA